MDLHHSFTVPTDVAATWEHFQDIATVAECFPGAQVTDVDGDTFTGSAKVKLGPIALVYNGTGTFVEKDEAAHRMVIDAKGKDKRGNGTAGAMVTMTMSEAEGGATEITVDTDLQITGKAVDCMPSPRPAMMLVAVPVFDCSTMLFTGRLSSEQ